jgi:hypothetical protein
MATSTNSHDKGGAESLLPGVVLSEVGSTSAHQAAVPDPPQTGISKMELKNLVGCAHAQYEAESWSPELW